jgi:hypothetical protein
MENNEQNNDDFSELKQQIEIPTHSLQLVKQFNLPAGDIDKLTKTKDFAQRTQLAETLAANHEAEAESKKKANWIQGEVSRRNAQLKQEQDFKQNGLWKTK